MAVQKGKPATKGQKQILEENKSTIKFYSLMSLGSLVVYISAMILLFGDQFTTRYWFLTFAAVFIYGASIMTMKYMAKPAYSESGSLIDGGIDLNMESGFAEHLKDLIILTAACQELSLLSNYFYFLWLFAPGRAAYMLWVNVLAPWFFQPAPEVEEAVNEKKQKKLERRQRRMQ